MPLPEALPSPAAPPTPHVCARCARCCVVVPGDEDMLFPLFDAEIRRLRDVAPDGLDPVVAAPNSPAFQEAMLRLFPDDADRVRELVPMNGTHMQLAIKDDGSCVFLGPEGCTLPRHVRPAHCTLFPLWFVRRRLRVLDADCLALREAKAIWKVLDLLQLQETTLREAFARLRQAWDLPPE
ncbi:YkgJ family cysteine cluster protein [Megalodesulfovibrio paquesii]